MNRFMRSVDGLISGADIGRIAKISSPSIMNETGFVPIRDLDTGWWISYRAYFEKAAKTVQTYGVLPPPGINVPLYNNEFEFWGVTEHQSLPSKPYKSLEHARSTERMMSAYLQNIWSRPKEIGLVRPNATIDDLIIIYYVKNKTQDKKTGEWYGPDKIKKLRSFTPTRTDEKN